MQKSLEKINSLGINLSKKQISLLDEYAELILSKRHQLNLTKINDKSHIWQRHITDGAISAALIKKHLSNKTNPVIADFGAGAGYIGIVIKIIFPYGKVYLVESVERKCAFLNWTLTKLMLKDIEVVCARADTSGSLPQADFVIERAMGKLKDILPSCLKAVKEGGMFLAYQSHKPSLDNKIQAILSNYNTSLYEAENYSIPYDDTKRTILIFKKH